MHYKFYYNTLQKTTNLHISVATLYYKFQMVDTADIVQTIILSLRYAPFRSSKYNTGHNSGHSRMRVQFEVFSQLVFTTYVVATFTDDMIDWCP